MGSKCPPGTEQQVDSSGATTCVEPGAAVDAQQNQVGNAAVVQMLGDKKLSAAVSTLQMAAVEEMGKRAQTLSAGSLGDQSSYPMTLELSGVQSDGYAYWRGESRSEPIWDLTFEALPTLTHLGTSQGILTNTHKIRANTQATITFDGGTFDDWGVASYQYGGAFDVGPMGATSTGGGWGLLGTM